MNRFIAIIAIITLSSLQLLSKEIHGIVVDTDSIPMEFVSITAFSNDSIIGSGTTNIDGYFRINVCDDCNRIRISFIGYQDVVLNTFQTNCNLIVLEPIETILPEVVVKAPLIRRESDRIVINVANNPLSSNKNAQELLKTAPGVWVSDNTLSIYGQGGTSIYIDDRKINMSGSQLISYLKTIQSSSISTIEVIPKTGAEYNADSSGGVIRINLKRNRVDGLTGSVGLNTTIGKYKQWYNPFSNISTHFRKWTINLSGNLNCSPSDEYTTHENSYNSQTALSLDGISLHKNKSIQGSLMFGLFYEPTDDDQFGIQIDYNTSYSKNNSNSQTEMISNNSSALTYGNYINCDNYHNFNTTFNWTHILDKKGSILKLISTYNYQPSFTSENNKMLMPSFTTDSIYSVDNSNKYHIFISELSFLKVFNSKWRINIGAKYTFNDIEYKSYHYFINEDKKLSNNNYDFANAYNENIVALYAAAYSHFGRWKFKAGLRGEYFDTKGGILSNSEFDFFPSANVSFDISQKGDYIVSVGYYKNIRRPSFFALNPTVRQISDFSYTVGNPDLTQSYTNSISLDFVLAGKFTIATGFSQTDNPIRQMFKSNPEYPERMYLTWDNNGKDQNLFFHGDGSVSITKWWNLYASVTYMITSQQLYYNSAFDTFGYLQLNASSSFLLPKGFNVSLNCFYNTKMKIGNITIFPILNLTPTIQKQFGKWNLSISAENVLQRKGKIRTYSSGYDRLTYTKSHLAIILGVSYNFNSGEVFKYKRIENNTDISRFSKE